MKMKIEDILNIHPVSQLALSELPKFEFFDLLDKITYFYEEGNLGSLNPCNSKLLYELGLTSKEPDGSFKLIFSRAQEPDIDIDFSESARWAAYDIARKVYGADKVALIGTHTYIGARLAFRSLCSVAGVRYKAAIEASALIPHEFGTRDAPEEITNFSNYFRTVFPKDTPERERQTSIVSFIKLELMPLMNPICGSLEDFATLIDSLIGKVKASSVHACGVAISSKPVATIMPLRKDENGHFVTQVPDDDVNIICSKIDLLTVRSIDTMYEVMDEAGLSDIPIYPLNQDVLNMIGEGRTYGCFQIGSPGISKMCKQFHKANQIRNLDDIADALSIYRPGPLDAGTDKKYIESRRTGVIEFDHPALRVLPERNFGIIIYQEDIQNIAVKVAGYDEAEADLIRYGIGKKIKSIVDKHHDKFIAGCQAHSGMTEEQAIKLWEQIETYSRYGFNKSHAVSYAYLAYKTAWLKYHYPTHWYAAYLNSRKNIAAIVKCISAATADDVPVGPPDINLSNMAFSPRSDSVIYGLLHVRGVGKVVADELVKRRPKNGYKSILQFVQLTSQKVNMRVMSSLVWAGAMDSLIDLGDGHRASNETQLTIKIRNRAIAEVTHYLSIKRKNKMREKNKTPKGREQAPYNLPDGFESGQVSPAEMHIFEKIALGRSVKLGNPAELVDLTGDILNISDVGRRVMASKKDGYDMALNIVACERKTARVSGKPYLRGEAEDGTGRIKIFCFTRGKKFDEIVKVLRPGAMVRVHVRWHISDQSDEVSIKTEQPNEVVIDNAELLISPSELGIEDMPELGAEIDWNEKEEDRD